MPDDDNPRRVVLRWIQIAEPGEAAMADFCVCLDADEPTSLTGNLTAPCHDCARLLQFRPYMPAAVPKICLRCATARTQGGHA